MFESKLQKRIAGIQRAGKLKVPRVKAVVTDFIGTLVNANYYDMDASRRTLHEALVDAGLETGFAEFLEAYTQAHEKYRVVRYEQFREVTNAVWVCEALNNLGCAVGPDDERGPVQQRLLLTGQILSRSEFIAQIADILAFKKKIDQLNGFLYIALKAIAQIQDQRGTFGTEFGEFLFDFFASYW